MWELGACTWVFGDAPLEEIARGLSSLGYTGVELLGDPNRYPPQDTRLILEENGLAIFSLPPLDVDLAHPDPEVRHRAIDYHLGLIEYAAELGAKVLSCHGRVGRVRPISSQEEEEKLCQEALAPLAERAEKLGLDLALEVLNRYKSSLASPASQALSFIGEIGSPRLGVLLDTYHMNIEEPDLPGAIRLIGDRLRLFHVADSNRLAPWHGYIPFPGIPSSLAEVSYSGPLVVECTAPGPNPFTPIKGPGWEEVLWGVGMRPATSSG